MKVKIYALDHNGRGIAKLDNKVIFIDNALVDEEVEIEIIEDKKKFMIGKVVDYDKKSNKRVDPTCIYYSLCGGCDIMHTSYNEQLEYKENKVKDIMTKYADIDSSLVKKIIGSKELNYRNKITLQVKEVLGLYKRHSYQIVNIDKCLITDKKSDAIINKLNTMDLKNINQIVIRLSSYYDESMLVIDTPSMIDEQSFIDNFKDINIVVKNSNDYKIINKNGFIKERLGDYDFIISPDSFFQVNTLGAKNLYDQVLNYIDSDSKPNILDLYCGTGTIGIYLSKYANTVLGIESNQYAVKDARENAKLNNIENISFKCGDVGTSINSIEFKPDVVVIDPPRAGLNGLAIKELLKVKSPTLIYVSCDPMTLARDLKLLGDDYKVIEIVPVDMFPNTYHVECVVKLIKK